MVNVRPVAFALLLPAALAAGGATAQGVPPSPPAPQDGVTIYRCVDAHGRLTLQDAPCRKGDRQDVRTMVRPKDAPYRPAAAVHAPMGSASPATTQVIVLRTPAPMYDCTTPDNTHYVSDSPEGNPRWVPAWALGYPVVREVPVVEPGHVDLRVDHGRLSGSLSTGGVGTAVVPTYAGLGGGMWIRDVCQPMPQAEVCGRLRDRRDEVRRRFAIAQPSERTVLDREERSINARLDQDCR